MKLHLTVLSALLVAGTATAQQPQRGGELVFAVNAEPPNYDCQATTTFVAMQTLSPHYSRLINFDPDNFPNFKAELAERWERSADGLAYTFHLRDDIKFHDGSALTSADIKATFDRIRKPPAGVVSVRKADYEDIAEIEAPDAKTIAKVSVALGARGSVRMETYEAIDVEALLRTLAE